ncbi:MAG: PilW family protein [Acidobacteriota bacterium]
MTTMMNLLKNQSSGARAGEAGFSLVELMVASLTSVLVVGGVLVMLDGLERVHRDTQELIDAQQSARLSLDKMTRDVQLAGVGLAWLLPPLPLIVPRVDGGIDIRSNQGGLTALLTADMSGPSDVLQLDDVSGFQVGMTIGLYDAGGAMDLVSVISVNSNTNQLGQTGASKAYTVVDGTAVARIETVTYRTQTSGGKTRLMRQQGTAAAQPMAENVQGLTITYYDDSAPPVAFNPTTLADQLRIRTVEINLVIETENVRLNTTQRRTATLTTRVTPRAVVLS